MIEKYVVTASGIKGGTPYSILSRIVSGKKENGDVYSFIDKTSQRENEQLDIGMIVEYQTTRIAQKQTTLNINSKMKED